MSSSERGHCYSSTPGNPKLSTVVRRELDEIALAIREISRLIERLSPQVNEVIRAYYWRKQIVSRMRAPPTTVDALRPQKAEGDLARRRDASCGIGVPPFRFDPGDANGLSGDLGRRVSIVGIVGLAEAALGLRWRKTRLFSAFGLKSPSNGRQIRNKMIRSIVRWQICSRSSR